MSRRLVAAAFCALVAGLAAPAAAQEVGPDAEPIGTALVRGVEMRDFPLVRLTVSTDVPGVVELGDVRVLENGVPVRVTAVDALEGTGERVEAVLAIDVSNSMAGEELQTALAAARAFVHGVPTSIPVGLVTFASQPAVLSRITTDRAAVEAALARVAANTSQGTALFRAVVTSTALFHDDPSVQRTVILLTDGKNTVPGIRGFDAARLAREAGVTVYTFALEGSDADETTLRSLAVGTGGRFESITTDELEEVYADLARELSEQFVVTYRSKAPHGVPVAVTVELPGGTATTQFLSPSLGDPQAEPGEPAGVPDRGLVSATSDAAIAVVVGLVFLASLNLILLLMEAVESRRRRVSLASRLGVEPTPADAAIISGSNPILPAALADAAERAAGTARTDTLARRLHQAGWSLRVGEFLALVVVAAVAAGVAGFVFLGPLGALFAVPAAILPYAVLSNAAVRRLAKIQSQLADTLMIIASSLRAGHSFLQALDTVTKEIDDPGRSEFMRTMREIRLGRDVDAALDGLVERVGSRDMEWTVTAIKIQRKIGGNLAEVLEGVAKTIRERETLRRQVRVLSAEGRISVIILTVLPIVVTAYLMRVNPEYLRALTSTRTGLFLLVAGGTLLLIGYAWMQKIVKLEDV